MSREVARELEALASKWDDEYTRLRGERMENQSWEDEADDMVADTFSDCARQMREVAKKLLPPDPGYLTIEEVAEYMRVSKMTVYRLCHKGELPAVMFGRSFRVTEAALQAYIQKNQYGAT